MWTTLGEIFTLQAGKNITSNNISPTQNAEYKYPCFGGNGIRGYVASSNRSGNYPIIGRQGALCGNVNLATKEFYATEHAVVVDYYCETDLMWCYYTLEALNLNQYATATAQPGLAVNIINEVTIPLPPYKEQKEISDAIDSWFSLIDAIGKDKELLQTVIRQAKRKILDLAIHGKLVPQDPNDEPATELLKRINPKAEITCDNPQYGKLPKGWCLCHIPDVANTLLGKTLDRSKNTGTPKDYLCAINVLWGKFDFTTHKQFLLEKNEYERYAVMKGDLMVCEGGDVGRCAIWEDDSKEIYYQNALHRIRCKEGVFNYYILYLLWHYKLNGTIDYLCKGVTIKHFTQTVMNKLDILLPPFEEQKRIVAKIEDLFTQLDKIESSLQA